MKSKIKVIILMSIAAIALGIFIFDKTVHSPDKGDTDEQIKSAISNSQEFAKNKRSITSANSLWVIVNKSRGLNPNSYSPKNLVTPSVPLRGGAFDVSMKLTKEASQAAELMLHSAKEEGISFMVASAYRSYSDQVVIYDKEVQQYGQAIADTQSARPGHSEHQTGLAVDFQDTDGQCVIADCFENLPAGKWLARNSWKYGFILRYPKNKQHITGYRFEPWHFRYVGEELSREMNAQNIQTLEEFFDITEQPPY